MYPASGIRASAQELPGKSRSPTPSVMLLATEDEPKTHELRTTTQDRVTTGFRIQPGVAFEAVRVPHGGNEATQGMACLTF